ncbi:MAG: DUF2339 domain-containing protein [Proteobacteria bacterium]|nr:DUF2339 domain-containing protein [Pseudomonadota bacterium]
MFAIAYLLAPIAAFVIVLRARGRIESMARRLALIEGRLAVAGPAPTAQLDAAATPVAETMDPPPAAPPPRPEPMPAAPPADVAASGAAAHAPGSAAAPHPGGPSLEERFGTRWVVWVGGAALALGGIFLVRYSIEQGLIGPGVRTALGALFAALLVIAGEWLRRAERASGFAGLPAAHIPGILTAAGTTVAYATVYAAYALYGFLAPPVAFLALGVVALAALAAALLHGPALAALGLVGAQVTPLLVTADEPDYWALYLYLAVVTAASLTLARMRLWRWLALVAIVASVLWMLPGIDARAALVPHAFHVVAGFALVVLLIVAGLFFGPPAAPSRVDGVSSLAAGAMLLAAMALVVAQEHATPALIVFCALTVAALATAWRADAAAAAVPAAALMAVLVIADWAIEPLLDNLLAPGNLTAGMPPEPATVIYEWHVILGGALAALFGGAGYLAQGRAERPVVPMLWAAAGAFTPLAMLIALYFRISAFERSLPFAGIALLLAALFAVATENLSRRAPRAGQAASGALFATGAIGALALAFTFALEKGWLTIALALMAPGIAWIATHRPLPLLRHLAAVLALIVVARVGFEPRIVGADVGTTPIFNWLLYGYGVPALAFWIAAHFMRGRADDLAVRVVDAAAILFTVLVVFLEIRHYLNGGDIYRASSSLIEVALQVSAGLALVIGLERIRARSGSIVHNAAALILAAGTLYAIISGLFLVVNPLLSGRAVGGVFFNAILLGYAIPALLATVLALVARATRPMAYRAVVAGTAVTLMLFYLTLQVRRLFHGPLITAGLTTDAEHYVYSAAWLAFALLLLAVGYLLASPPARLAAAAVILLTIGKVFLIDTANLAGIWRALSLIGLGLPLVAVGYFYQRMMFPRRAQPGGAGENLSGGGS